ncbi:MAG: lysophospholipid acyltransferase family protein [Kiritimatiellia bacterium]
MREGFFTQPLYWLARGSVYLLLLAKYRMRTFGREHVPARGGAVIVANHCSYLDPPVMGGANSRRIVHFLARDTLFSNPLARWFFPRVGVIALDRTKGDLGALKKALATLKEGKVVGLFPEGTRSPDGQMRTAKGGIGFLIAKGNVPVVPLHVSGTFAAFPKGANRLRPSRIVARFGPPLAPAEILAAMTKKNDYEAVGALVMRRIAALAEESKG